MSKRWIKAASTSQTIDIFVLDSSSTVGAGLTGLVFNTAGLTCYYRKGALGTPTAITLATLATVGTAWSSGGFIAVDGTTMPGVYRLDIPNVVLDTAGMVTMYLRGATNMAPVVLEIEVVSVDIYDTVRFGLTSIPNVAQGTTGAISTGNATGQVTVATNNDKSSYTLTVTPPTAAAISTAVWSETVRVLTAGTNIVLAKTTNITGFNDITAVSVWDVLASAVSTASSIGLQLKTNVDAAITSRMATFTYTTPPTAAAISTQVWTEPIPGTFAAGSAGAKLNSASSAGDPWSTAIPGSYAAGTAGNILGNRLDTAITTRMASFTYTAPPSVADIWNTNISAYSSAGFAGTYLKNAMATFTYTTPPTVAQIWQTDVSAFSTVGQAGTYLKNAMPTFTYTAPPTAIANADALLGRNIAGGSDGGRTVKDAFRVLRNKVSISGATLTVTTEDDATTAWTAALTTDAAAIPVTGIDPAGP